jgi:hypothetical protein
MFALPTAINTHGPGLSDFLKINKPQLLCENVFVKWGRAVGHNFERDPPRDHPCQV